MGDAALADTDELDGSSLFDGNRLLASLNRADRALIAPHLSLVALPKGGVLFEPGEDVTHAHFPIGSALASLVIVMPDGSTADAATVGREGAIGGIVSAGHKPAFARAVVQIGGLGYRIDSQSLEEAKHASAALRDVFARYADCLVAQLLQSVACNALHDLEHRLARWLLMTQDRVGGSELPLTQEVLSEMLGVQRTSVTAAARALQSKGLIITGRGRIGVLDRAGLEAAACPCHDAIRSHYEALLPGVMGDA